MAAASSPLSPMSTTAVCLASAFSKRMSDLFLLPCVVSPSPSPTPLLPPAPFLASVHTLRLSHSGCPGPPPLLSPLQCLHMQSPSECAMSFLLGSASSFTVDWFLFRSRGNGPPPPLLHHSPFLPLLLFFPQGRQTAWEMGPTCAAWWMAAPLSLHVSRLPGGGRGGLGPPSSSRYFVSCWGDGGEGKPSHPPAPQSASPSGCGRGEDSPTPVPRAKLLRSAAPPPPPPTRCTQTPTRAQTFVLLIW